MRLMRHDDAVCLAFPLAEANDPRIFADADDYIRAGRRQTCKKRSARFITAMLAPLCIERVEFDQCRIAPESLRDAAQLSDGEGDPGATRLSSERCIITFADRERARLRQA